MSQLSSHLQNISRNQALIAALISAVTMILAAIAGLTGVTNTGSSDSGQTNQGSSGYYIAPPPEQQVRLDQIKVELTYAVNQLRAGEFDVSHQVTAPVTLDTVLEMQAENAAKSNAVTGQQPPLKANVGSVQAVLPVEEASAHAFMDLFLSSPPHAEVLLDPQYSFYGVSVTQGHGKVWVVLTFSRA